MNRDWLSKEFGLEGQVAVLTGGSGVLGRSMALGLARAGARPVIVSRRLEACQAVADEVKAEGGEAMAVAADATDAETLERATERIEAEFGPVEILVNGAGGGRAGASTSPSQSFFDLDLEAVSQVVNLNFMGAFLACRAFGRGMARRGRGVIINVTSMTATRPLSRVAAYGAGKAALANFTQWLAAHMAQEHSPHIRVNGIAPGFFPARQNNALLFDEATGGLTERGERIIAHTPMGRFGEPDELMGTLIWLASPASAFVTGIVVPVDGGFQAYSGV